MTSSVKTFHRQDTKAPSEHRSSHWYSCYLEWGCTGAAGHSREKPALSLPKGGNPIRWQQRIFLYWA